MRTSFPGGLVRSDRAFLPQDKSVSAQVLERRIARRQGIADITGLREGLLTWITQQSADVSSLPVHVQLRNRAAHLRPLRSFFYRLLDPDSASPRIRSLVQNLQVAARLGWEPRAFRVLPSVFDRRFGDPNDLLEPIFAAIFQDADLLSQWMEALDARVEASSRALLEAMDRARQAHQGPLRRDVVLVGGGPLTSIVASILGAYFHLTVITDQRGVGKPWRNRPLYINSSSQIIDFNGAPLPLLPGCTTRIIGRQQLNSLDMDLLLGSETKVVRCDAERSVEYVAGPRMGELIATNMLLHADEYLLNQTVDVARLQRLTDGRLRLVLRDTESATERELVASFVFFLTGPGRERSAVPNRSPSLYEAEASRLETTLRQARKRLTWCREAQKALATAPVTPGLHVQKRWLSLQGAQTPIALPRVLTLTAMEKLYEFWMEGGADPAAFPLRDVLTTPSSMAYLGNGDTMRTLKELMEGRGPALSYPEGIQIKTGRSTIYNERISFPFEYDRANRRRYQGILTETTKTIPFRALRYRVKPGTSLMEVVHEERQGRSRRRVYQYVFDCTGLERRPLEAALPPAFALAPVRDLEGKVVGRGDGSLFVVGAATAQTAATFPEELRAILRDLGIAENTISLWVNGLLAERLAYTFAATHLPTKWLPAHA